MSEFEKAAGFREHRLQIHPFQGWDREKRIKRLGAAVRLVLNGHLEDQRRQLESAATRYEQIAAEIRSTLVDVTESSEEE